MSLCSESTPCLQSRLQGISIHNRQCIQQCEVGIGRLACISAMSPVALWQEHLVVGRYWAQLPAGSLLIFFLFLQSLHCFLPISLPMVSCLAACQVAVVQGCYSWLCVASIFWHIFINFVLLSLSAFTPIVLFTGPAQIFVAHDTNLHRSSCITTDSACCFQLSISVANFDPLFCQPYCRFLRKLQLSVLSTFVLWNCIVLGGYHMVDTGWIFK